MKLVEKTLESPPAAAPLFIDADTVHLWKAWISSSMQSLDALTKTLSADELDRAGRYTLPSRRSLFILARGTLKHLLGRYLDKDPAALGFEYGAWGKPSLAEPEASSGLCFNLSHSFDLLLVAVAQNREVGVDVERLSHTRPVMELARRFFVPSEAEALEALSETDRVRAFYQLWTSKEASLKASGRGLDLFDRNGLIDEGDLAFRLDVHNIDVGRDYSAALAVDQIDV